MTKKFLILACMFVLVFSFYTISATENYLVKRNAGAELVDSRFYDDAQSWSINEYGNSYSLFFGDGEVDFISVNDSQAFYLENYQSNIILGDAFDVVNGPNLVINPTSGFIFNNGNVGIGVEAPVESLEIDGNIISDNFQMAYDVPWQVLKVGYESGYGNAYGNGGTSPFEIGILSVGNYAGRNNSGEYLTAFGNSAGRENTGSNLVAVGSNAGYQNTGGNNVFVGSSAGYQNTGTNIVGIGDGAGYQNIGANLHSLGYYAGRENTGDNSILIGYLAGYLNSGDDVIAIGYEAGKSNSLDKQFIVKQNNVNTVPLIQGDFLSGKVGIGTVSPAYKLDVAGDISSSADFINDGNTGLTGVYDVGTCSFSFSGGIMYDTTC